MDNNDTMIRETYRLVQDNNRMLHAMRRSAFIGGFFRFIIWAIVLIGPIWFYMNYLNPLTQTLIQSVNKAEAVGANAQTQLSGVTHVLQNVQAQVSHIFNASSTKGQ